MNVGRGGLTLQNHFALHTLQEDGIGLACAAIKLNIDENFALPAAGRESRAANQVERFACDLLAASGQAVRSILRNLLRREMDGGRQEVSAATWNGLDKPRASVDKGAGDRERRV
jgi:hypothetical protein